MPHRAAPLHASRTLAFLGAFLGAGTDALAQEAPPAEPAPAAAPEPAADAPPEAPPPAQAPPAEPPAPPQEPPPPTFPGEGEPPPPTFPGEGEPPPPTFPGAGGGAAEMEPARVTTEVAPFPEEAAEPSPTPDELGVFGLNLGLALMFGGDELVTAEFSDGSEQTISAGGGAMLSIGFTVTPLRSNGHALGFALDQGVKFEEITARNASVSLVRFPLIPSLRYSYWLGGDWLFVASGGLVYEYGIELSGDGDASDVQQSFDNAVGWMGEGGVAYVERQLVVDIMLRYTGIAYDYEVIGVPETVDADNGGLIFAVHYVF